MENLEIEQIIQNSLTGSLTPEEENKLAEWRAASATNEADYQAYWEAWEVSGKYQSPVWKVEEAISRFEKKFGNDPQANSREAIRRTIPIWRKISIAASIFILLAIGSFAIYKAVQTDSLLLAAADGGNLKFELPDGSYVHLQKGSKLEYPENFSKSLRNVELEGEAFFEIEKNPEKPFIVETSRSKVTVLGTAFVLDASNESNQVTDLYVTEGSVSFQSNSNDEVKLTLNAGDQASLRGNALTPIKQTSFNDISWHTRTLVFRNVSMEEAAKDLSAFYGIEIDLSRSQISGCKITAPLPFENAPLSDVLTILETLLSCKIEKTAQNQYVIVGGKCK